MNRTKNRTPGHMLSNNGLYLCAERVAILSVGSYSSHPFLCAFGRNTEGSLLLGVLLAQGISFSSHMKGSMRIQAYDTF